MASLSGGFTSQESAYDFTPSPINSISFLKEQPKLKSNDPNDIINEETYNKGSISNSTPEFTLSQIPNENISFNNVKSQRFNSKDQTLKISNSQNIIIYNTARIAREFDRDKSLKRSLAVKAISQNKYSTNEVFDIASWNNLTEKRKAVISNDIYNLTVSGKNIDLQLIASYIIWRKLNG